MTFKQKYIKAVFILILSAAAYIAAKRYYPFSGNTGFSLEKYVPENPSLIVSVNNIDSVRSKLEHSNFYSSLSDFTGWLNREMPSETLGFYKDLSDVKAGMENEFKNINLFKLFENKILLSVWIENPDDRKYIIIAKTKKEKRDMIQSLPHAKLNYLDTDIHALNRDKYWAHLNGNLLISNDMGTMKKSLDLMLNKSTNSAVSGANYSNSAGLISAKNYIYISPGNISPKYTRLIDTGINALFITFDYAGKIIIRTYLYFKDGQEKQKNTAVTTPGYLPQDRMFFTAGNITLPYFRKIFGTDIVFYEHCFAVLPYQNKSSFIIISKSDPKGIKTFNEKYADKTFNITLPYFGNFKTKAFTLKNNVFFCIPPAYAETVRQNAENKPAISFNSMFNAVFAKKYSKLYYADISKIYSFMLKKPYVEYIPPCTGYTKTTAYGTEMTFNIPVKDLKEEIWGSLFTDIKISLSKNLIKERETVTYGNLKTLREALAIYNSKTRKYPVKLKSLVDEYINEIPQEKITKSNKVYGTLNGNGGWYYNNGNVMLNIFNTSSSGDYYTQW